MYQTIDHNKYSEHLKNLPLFLRGRKLERSVYGVYVFLYKQAARRGAELTIKSTVAIIAASLGRDIAFTLNILIQLKQRELFERFELTEGRVFIKIKNLEGYARYQK